MAPVRKNNRRHRKDYNEPGHAHELTFSCYRQFQFLSRDQACEWLVKAIDEARTALDFDVWAWVIMPEHVHLIVHPRQKVYSMTPIRRLIKEPVAKDAIAWIKDHAPNWLAKIARPRGVKLEYLFWQSGGGYDRNVTEGRTLLNMIDYIHENPVRRGLVTRAIDWKWSSAAWYADQSIVPLVPDRIPPEWLADT